MAGEQEADRQALSAGTWSSQNPSFDIYHTVHGSPVDSINFVRHLRPSQTGSPEHPMCSLMRAVRDTFTVGLERPSVCERIPHRPGVVFQSSSGLHGIWRLHRVPLSTEPHIERCPDGACPGPANDNFLRLTNLPRVNSRATERWPARILTFLSSLYFACDTPPKQERLRSATNAS